MGKFSSGSAIGVMIVMICSRITGAPATAYTVGDTSGWATGGDYSTWASGKTFVVGDTLAFNYAPGHTVDQVSENDYSLCTTGNSITSDSSGTTLILLRTAGPYYFICSIQGHCSGGMKLAVTVAAAESGGGGAPSSPRATTSPAPPTGIATPSAGTLTQVSSSAAVATFFAFLVVVFN